MKNKALKFNRYVFILLFLFCLDSNVLAFQIKKSRPRLFSHSHLKEITKRRSKKRIFNGLKKEADFNIKILPEDLFENSNNYCLYVKLYSFLYYMERKEIYYEKAKECIKYILSVHHNDDDYIVLAQLQAVAYYYDFCFENMEEVEKENMTDEVLKRISWLKSQGLLFGDNYGGSHFYYANRIICLSLMSTPCSRYTS